jgi:hypothetical protein
LESRLEKPSQLRRRLRIDVDQTGALPGVDRLTEVIRVVVAESEPQDLRRKLVGHEKLDHVEEESARAEPDFVKFGPDLLAVGGRSPSVDRDDRFVNQFGDGASPFGRHKETLSGQFQRPPWGLTTLRGSLPTG